MEIICIGIILVFIITLFVVSRNEQKSQEDESTDTYISSNLDSETITTQEHNRWFKLSEIKQAENGKYSWDESGCVFEINSDGSVTIVGHFDPAELLVDPVQELIERLNNDGLIEMLPRMCSLQTVNNKCGEDNAFVLVWNDDILSVPSCPHTIEEVKNVSLIISSLEGGKSVITDILSKTANGYLTLMPSNEKEYILSLGAKACVEQALGDKVRIKISSPAVMGALGIAIKRTTDKQSKISFAFGEDEDYMCCNLFAENGVYEVQKLLHCSIIQPSETFSALQHIAKGCMVQALIREGYVRNHLLIDMLPYTMSLLLKENGRIIKFYDCISKAAPIPMQGYKNINIDANKDLSFLIGSTVLIENVIAECNAPNGKISAFIEVDSNMDVEIKITSQYNDYIIKVGQLIG